MFRYRLSTKVRRSVHVCVESANSAGRKPVGRAWSDSRILLIHKPGFSYGHGTYRDDAVR